MSLTDAAAGPHHGQPILAAGKPLQKAAAAMIMVHGRGASAADILGLAQYVGMAGLAYLAPQAAQHTWYPYSFLAPLDQNEPDLSAALARLGNVLGQVQAAGIPAGRTIWLGFSQGGCLASEFVARNTRRYGGLIVFSGGLIGPPGTARDYQGSLDGMPVFIGCSDVDPHIPVERVHETAATLEKLGAQVTKQIYPGMGHTIIQAEIDQARAIIQAVVGEEE